MRARLESYLNDTWYGGRAPGFVLRTAERCYRRAFAYAQSRELASAAEDLRGAPIIVVGNITAGGTGKTPLVIRLCGLLVRAGLKPAVVSRGYGRRSGGEILVGAGHSAREVGDEPMLIQHRCGIPVSVAVDRVSAVRNLFRAGADVVISDDGLQRRRMPRTMEICVVDGVKGFGNRHLLPAGPLREPASRLDSVDYVICNGEAEACLGLPASIVMRLEPGQPQSLDGQSTLTLEQLVQRSRETALEAVAGIGDPGRFFRMLKTLGIRANEHGFADHHDYAGSDFDGLRANMVLMTEKDAVKCRGLGLKDAWYLPVDAVLPEDWEREVVSRTRALVAGKGTA